jgi:hypothetical protein
MPILPWDVETRSAANLNKVGARNYAADPSTVVLSVISNVVRNVIVAKPGHVLIGADFSATMAQARANGLPGSLEEAAALLGLVNQKRWAGRSFQPQNLPKVTIADIDAATDAVHSGDHARVRALNGGDTALRHRRRRRCISASAIAVRNFATDERLPARRNSRICRVSSSGPCASICATLRLPRFFAA